ncbi:MAG: hypothetical protein KAJ33_04830, partial [Thermoplasmata archaeon]|nr:hypothetical protein [Thermoplasmata archaeon]
MKRKSLSVLLILILAGILLSPVLGDTLDDLTVTVSSGQSTSITNVTTIGFGSLAPGANNTVTDAFQLTNAGNEVGYVSAAFTTNVSAIYGMTNASTYVIGGGNVSMNGSGSLVDLDNTATPKAMTGNDVAADAVADVWNVELNIP